MKPPSKNPAKLQPTATSAAAAAAQAKFMDGLALHQKGRLAQAQALYQAALKMQPKHFDALHMMGVIAYQTNDSLQAIELIDRAIAINQNDAAAYSNRGNALRELKRHEEAVESYQRALKLKPDYADALYNLGSALRNLQRQQEALENYNRALGIKPDHTEALHNLGNALNDMKRHEQALESYERALAIKPDYAEALNNRGGALSHLKRHEEALENYERALRVKPDFAKALNNRGGVLSDLRRHQEALDSYELALRIEPDDAEALTNRGVALSNLERHQEALDGYERALTIMPDYAEALNNRGSILSYLKRHEEALEDYGRALRIKPDFVTALNNRGGALSYLEQHEEALENYERALTIMPDSAETLTNRGSELNKLHRYQEALESYERALTIKPDYDYLYGTWLHDRMQICDWKDLRHDIATLTHGVDCGAKVSPPFPVLALSGSLPLQRKTAEIWTQAECPVSDALPAIAKRPRRDRIRIGYFSADFRHHPISLLIAGLFETQDRSRFELTAFSFGPDTQDATRKRIETAVDHFIDVRGKTDVEVALLARKLRIDIAVDLGGFTGNSRTHIFAMRAAPIQVSYLGYLGTMGAEYIDYLIADPTIVPAASRKYYSEKIVWLPSYQANDSKRQIVDRSFTRQELGLPEEGFIFCCFNNNYKIMPSTFDSWMRVLKRAAGSVLYLHEENELAANNLRKEAVTRGVESGRLIFGRRLPLPAYLARFRAADLFLDTLPYNAGTTASDALWAGLPVLTSTGETFASRVAASLLNAIDLPELITATEEEYESRAIELATHPQRLEEIKQKLEQHRFTTPLFDTKLFTRSIEAAYTQMHERFQSGLPPAHIKIKQQH